MPLSIFYQKLLLGLIFSLFGVYGKAVNIIDVELEYLALDQENSTICYQINIINRSNDEINLAGQNYRLFYNSSTLSIITDSLKSNLPLELYTNLELVQSDEGVDGSGFGLLPYESSIGFVNLYIDMLNTDTGGVIIAEQSKISIFEICFEVDLDNLEFFCPEINFGRESLTSDYATAFIEVSEWLGPGSQTSLQIENYYDTGIEEASDYCIYFLENEFIPCNDLIDNDGDGDIDCDDLDCGKPEIVNVVIVNPTCIDEESGSITIEATGINMLNSINAGQDYSSDTSFENLSVGEYIVYVINENTGCIDSLTVTLDVDSDVQEDCNDLIDNDCDGDIDCDDLDCGKPEIVNVVIVNPTCIDEESGSITIEATGINMLNSINAGQDYSSDTSFENLSVGEYIVYVINENTGCIDSLTVTLDVDSDVQEDCNDLIDNDCDGDIDCDDLDCGKPEIVNVVIVNPTCIDEESGSITIEATGINMLNSINAGQDYSSDTSFENLSVGEYIVYVINENTGCIDSLTVTLDNIVEQEVCGDLIDNDCDGLIDEQDMDCNTGPLIFVPNIIYPGSLNSQNAFFSYSANFTLVKAIEKCTIFDRWGNIVYVNNEILEIGFSKSWDGQHNSNKLVKGVYVVLLNYTTTSGQKQQYISDLTII